MCECGGDCDKLSEKEMEMARHFLPIMGEYSKEKGIDLVGYFNVLDIMMTTVTSLIQDHIEKLPEPEKKPKPNVIVINPEFSKTWN